MSIELTTPNYESQTLEQRIEKSRHLKIVITCTPNMGHMVPSSHIAEALQEAGHEVTMITINCEKTRWQMPRLFDKMGVKCILTEGPDESVLYQMLTPPKDSKELYVTMWQPHCVKACKEAKPDLIISDFFGRNGIIAADEMKIPSVVNCGLPLKMFVDTAMFKLIDQRNTSRCCGCLCVSQSCADCAIQCLYKSDEMKEAKKFNSSFNKRTVLVNSFFGLENPIAMPPNFVITGPLYKQPGDLRAILKEKDEKLYNWMEEALEKKISIVYISIGSEVKWQQWSIDVMYEGLKKLKDTRVIWSLRNTGDLKKPEGNENFWISDWVPQIEILSHPAIKAGLTHCGMGGTLEFINMGVPAVLWPHCGD